MNGRSTTTAFFHYINGIYKAEDSGFQGMGIFFDLSEAFDLVDHSVLLNKLNKWGTRSVANDWVHSFIEGREQIV